MAADGATIALTFQVECTATKPGEAVFVCGSTPEIGDWDGLKAVPCMTTPKVFPHWTSESVTLPASTGKLDFKVLVQRTDGDGKARWEDGGNRSVHLPKSTGGQVQVTAKCKWGDPEVTCRTKIDNKSTAGSSAQAHFAPVDQEELPKKASAISSRSKSGMERRNSRHLCIDNEGKLNADMSRTPSLMLIDEAELHDDANKYEEKLEELERDRLNKLQRRMQSGSLLEEMRGIVDVADKNSLVLLQGFNWESWRAGSGDWYSLVKQKVGLMKEIGITDIWLPPSSQSVAPQGYLPSQLFNLDGSKYGPQSSLEDLLKTLHENGIRGVADIVVNHRCGDKQDEQGRWNQFTSGIESRPSFAGVMDWGGWAITLGDKFSDGTGQHHPDTMDGKFDAAPDIDHKNEKVQQSISIWLRWMQLQVGFDAWRFDFVKGYGAQYVGHYCKKSAPAWAVGELWGDMAYDDSGLCHNQDKHRQDLVNWINATDKLSTAFDFTTKGILQEACRKCEYWRLRDSNGKPPGLIGWLPQYAVTFIDNHDTGSTQRHWPFPDDKVLVGYAYICTHPGMPTLFWDHVMDWGEDHRRKISDMLRARRESGIKVDAKVQIHTADGDFYLADIGQPPTLRVALGPRGGGDPQGDGWSMACAGNQFRIWVKKQAPAPAPAPTPAPKKQPKPPADAQAPTPTPKEQPKAEGKIDFPPINIDGAMYTPQKLQSMALPELEKLSGRVGPVLQATNAMLAEKKK